MKAKLFCLLFCVLIGFTKNSFSQCITSNPSQGFSAGCTASPTGSITISSSGSKLCYSGTSTISTLTINGNNDTIYINGNISITNITGNGANSFIVVNSGKKITIANQPSNFWTVPSFVNYGTMDISSSWSGFSNGNLITIGSSSVINISGDLTLNGATFQLDGGTLNVSGTTTLNSASGGACLKSNGILKTKDLVTNSADRLTVSPSSLACIYYTGNATIWSELTNSVLNVVKGPSATVTGTGWGPHTTVSSGDPTSCAILLPMQMGDFSLSNYGGKVFVNWSTFSEQNSNHFEIQRSADAINFLTIGTVSASGNSASVKQYSFTDFYPFAGNDFYRIKLLADDSNTSYSSIKQIEIKSPTEMKVIVNNSQNNIKVIMPQNAAQSTLRLLDMQGRTLKTVKQAAQEELVIIETSNILSGIYIVELLSQNMRHAKQVFILSQK